MDDAEEVTVDEPVEEAEEPAEKEAVDPTVFERGIYYFDMRGEVVLAKINQLAAEAVFEMSADPGPRSTDMDILREVWMEDVYDLDPRVLTGRVVVDFGAHMGAFAIRAACQGARVFAFECDSENATRIQRNVELTNSLLRQELEVAVFTNTIAPVGKTFVGIHRNKDDGMSTALVDDDIFTHKDVDMDVIPITVDSAIIRVLDQVDPHFLLGVPNPSDSPIALLKCDIEGSEYKSFLNCVYLKYVERIEMEIHESKYGQLGTLIEHLLKTHRVNVFGVPERGGMLTAIRY